MSRRSNRKKRKRYEKPIRFLSQRWFDITLRYLREDGGIDWINGRPQRVAHPRNMAEEEERRYLASLPPPVLPWWERLWRSLKAAFTRRR